MKQTLWLCPGCGCIKVLERDFHRLKRTRTGYKPRCKDCLNAAQLEWRQNNPEKSKAQQKRHYRKNRPARLALSAKYEVEHRDRLNAKRRKLNADAYAEARAANPELPERNRHAAPILNETKVREIRLALRAGAFQSDLARAYGVSRATISAIKRWIIWKDVTIDGQANAGTLASGGGGENKTN